MRGTLLFLPLFIAGCSCASTVKPETQRKPVPASLAQLEADGLYFVGETGDSSVYRWPDSTKNSIRVWIEPSPAVLYENPEFVLVAQSAFEQWVEAGAPVSFTFVSSQDSAQVRVFWADTLPEGKAGWADVERDDGVNITAVRLRLALRTFWGRPLTALEIRRAALHEVGHAIGLGHPSAGNRVMTRSPAADRVTSQDAAVAKILYTLPPGLTKRSLLR